MSGYGCGGSGEPCDGRQRPYFRPGEGATRGQAAKIVSQALGLTDSVPAGQQTFADVPNGNPFWVYIERLLVNRLGVMGGLHMRRARRAMRRPPKALLPPQQRLDARPGVEDSSQRILPRLPDAYEAVSLGVRNQESDFTDS